MGQAAFTVIRVPAHVEGDFRQYRTDGYLPGNFTRTRCASSGDEFVVAFSYSGRGVRPYSNIGRMVETAGHLVDHVFSQVPVRQRLLSVAKRLRYCLYHEFRTVNPVLGILLQEAEKGLLCDSSNAPAGARLAAVTFVHRFRSALSADVHFHSCVIDGVFGATGGGVQFRPAFLTDAAITRAQQQTRRRVCGLRFTNSQLPTQCCFQTRGPTKFPTN